MNYQLYKQKIIDEYIINHQEYINSTLDFYEEEYKFNPYTFKLSNNKELNRFIVEYAKEHKKKNKVFSYPVGKGNNPDFMIIGINPSTSYRKENIYLRPTLLLSFSGFLLRKSIDLYLPKDKSFYITNIYKSDSFDHTIIKEEIELVKPKQIICLGNIPYNILKNIKIENIIKINHPSYFTRNKIPKLFLNMMLKLFLEKK